MNNLSKVLIFKIGMTILFWSIPLLLFPARTLTAVGFPEQSSYMFMRLLGWAYLSLCVGYVFSLQAALRGKRLMAPIWAGLVSNGGASLILFVNGLTGGWSDLGAFLQFVFWGSAVATLLITIGLYLYGVKGEGPIVASVTQ